jgi:hypothetical protein
VNSVRLHFLYILMTFRSAYAEQETSAVMALLKISCIRSFLACRFLLFLDCPVPTPSTSLRKHASFVCLSFPDNSSLFIADGAPFFLHTQIGLAVRPPNLPYGSKSKCKCLLGLTCDSESHVDMASTSLV